MENNEKTNEAKHVEEEIDKSPLYNVHGASTDRSLFVSQFDKEIEDGIKIDSNNEGVYPSLENRVNVSYLVENENYFGGNGKDISLIEESPGNKTNYLQRGEYENKLPSKTDLSIKDNTCVSVNIKQSTFEMSDQYINKAVSNKLHEEKINLKKQNINILLGQDGSSKLDSYILVVEKCVVKDLIGSHKLYEIQFLQNEEKKINCYRRYDNFDKFNAKLRKKFPYILIPSLTPKNPLIKIISPDEDFFLNRQKGLNFFLNFIYKNEILSQSREFHKFTHDAEFDEGFFNSKEDENYIYFFPESSSISDTFKNKIYGVFSGIFGGQEERKLNDDEILLRRMETHYKGIATKYKEIKNNVVNYLKSIKTNADEYKSLSSSCFYMKDTLPDVPEAQPNFKNFFEICEEIFLVNKKNYQNKAIELEFKFDSFISILNGLCDAFDRYNEYNKLYENVLKAFRHAKSNHLDNFNKFNEELKACERFKVKFDKNLIIEIKNFVDSYNNSFSELIEEFKLLLRSINSEAREVSQK